MHVSMNVNELWDFSDPAESARRFQEAIKGASEEDAWILNTQLARAIGLQFGFERAQRVLSVMAPEIVDSTSIVKTYYYLELGRTHASAAHPRTDVTPESQQLARDAYEQAIDHAKLANLDGLHVDALHMMMFTTDDLAEQLSWSQRALDLAQSSTQPEAQKWQASLLNNIGYTYHDLAKYDDALQAFEQALTLREASGSVKSQNVARWMVAWTLRALARVEDALTIQLALEQTYNTLNTPSVYVYDELALLYEMQGDDDRAQHYRALKTRLVPSS